MSAHEMYAPAITEARTDYLFLLPDWNEVTVTVKPWQSIAAGQRVWLDVLGETKDGDPRTIVLYAASPVIQKEVQAGLSVELKCMELKQFKNESNITIRLCVSFDGSTDKGAARIAPTQAYKLMYPSRNSLAEANAIPSDLAGKLLQ